MKKVLLSIRPELANSIFNGEKLFAYRKKIFKDENINSIVVYASRPCSKVIGEFTIGEIIKDTPSNLWEKTKDGAGITKEFFDDYFRGKIESFAIKIKRYHRYDTPYNLNDLYPDIKPPQNFCYIED
jgi:predicted transcriptional regulator